MTDVSLDEARRRLTRVTRDAGQRIPKADIGWDHQVGVVTSTSPLEVALADGVPLNAATLAGGLVVNDVVLVLVRPPIVTILGKFGGSGGADTDLPEAFNTATPTTAYTADCSVYPIHKLTMGGNTAITLSGASGGSAWKLTFYLIQDGTGSRVPSFTGGTVKWPGGVAPTFSTAPGATDVVVMETLDGGTNWFANLAGKAYA